MKKIIPLLLLVYCLACTKKDNPVLQTEIATSAAKPISQEITVNITYKPSTFLLTAETVFPNNSTYYRSGLISLVQYTGSSFEFPYYQWAANSYKYTLSLAALQPGRYFFKATYLLDGISYSSPQTIIVKY